MIGAAAIAAVGRFVRQHWAGMAMLAMIIALAWRIDGLKADNAALAVDLQAAQATAELSEALRGQEQSQGQASFNAQADRCEQRITQARNVGRIIQETVNHGSTPEAVQPGPGGRALIPADVLRQIAGQAGPGEAAGLPPRSDGAPAR